MLYEIVIDKTTNRVVEIGSANKDRFREEPERYLITKAEVPHALERKIFCMGWDGEKIIEVDPPEGQSSDGTMANLGPDLGPSVDEKIQAALEQQRQEFTEMLLKSGIKIS